MKKVLAVIVGIIVMMACCAVINLICYAINTPIIGMIGNVIACYFIGRYVYDNYLNV